ncbi:helix-hairpin-helix domain-containing protein [candidate division WOR-3 bacterium]|nr:helix-hairpin-helix domain-containing protein [candidate division WOR-3 bacterium]
MTGRERTVLLFLTAMLLVGSGVTLYRRARLARAAAMAPLVVENPADTTVAVDIRVDLNTAEAWELELLPGIGPKLALRIIEYRDRHGPFRSPGDLLKVNGIGPKKLDAIRELVKCGIPEPVPVVPDSIP